MIGRSKTGEFHTSPPAMYPPGMCLFIAQLIFYNWIQRSVKAAPCGMGGSPDSRLAVMRPPGAPAGSAGVRRVVMDSSTPRRRIFNKDDLEPELSEWLEPTNGKALLLTESEVKHETDRLEKDFVHRPIKDELILGPTEPESGPLEADITSEEESEMLGQKRPLKGAGWWGIGPPLRPTKKGATREFVDGAGMCSPGRWAVKNRRLPDDFASKRIRHIFREGLKKCEAKLESTKPPMDLKKLLVSLAAGKIETLPFDSTLR